MNDFIVYALLMGSVAGAGGAMPFWSTMGENGLMPSTSSAIARVGAHTEYDESKTIQYRWGLNMQSAYSASETTFVLDQAYFSLKWKALSIDLGLKHRELDYMASEPGLGSLSVTGGHFFDSGNALAMPGYRAYLDPVAIPFTKSRLFLYGSYGDFYSFDDVFVKNTLRHRLEIMFRFRLQEKLSFDFGVDHYAQWGGEHPRYGADGSQVTFANYIRMAIAAHGGDDAIKGDQINVLGDQGGSIRSILDYRSDSWNLTLEHDIPYNDGSGMKFKNFPDGVNTIHFGFRDKNKWVSDILYEYHYTMNQSGPAHDVEDTPENRIKYKNRYTSVRNGRLTLGGDDDYGNNGLFYEQGWTYFGKSLGNPLMTVGELGFINNRVKAHHIGISGKLFETAPYRLMLTWSENYGRFKVPFERPLKQFSSGFKGFIPFYSKLPGKLFMSYNLSFDRGELYGNQCGLSLGIKYTL